MTTARSNRPLAEQILDRCVETPSGCWEFTGSLNSTGYGVVNRRGKLHYNHRVLYEYMRAEIPEGLHLDHACMNRPCCNPFHLEPVSCAENVRRAHRGGRCKRGHERTPDNLYQRAGQADPYTGQCRKCIEIRWRGNRAA